MISITAISSLATGEGKRLVVTYSEVDDRGEFVRQNMKKNYVATATEALEAIAVLEKDALAHIEEA